MLVNRDSENSISIILTEEELFDNYEILIEDLFNEEKRPEISKKLIEIVASVLVQFNISKNQGLKLEISLSQKGEVIIKSTFNEAFNENNLKGIESFVSEKVKKENLKDFLEKLNLTPDQKEKIIKDYKDKENALMQSEYIFEFNSLSECINSSNYIKNLKIKDSILYKNKNKYYLYVQLLEDTNIEYISFEFCLNIKPNIFKTFLSEHGEIIIKKDALSIINNL